ncbi:MAG TPA: stalk domain-containing protein [Clostridia bacterium]
MIKERFKGFISGVIASSLLLTGITVFANSIDVETVSLKYFFDGVEKAPPSDQQGFIYKGRTYVPLRFISEALDKNVSWEGKTSSIYIGKQPDGKVTYLEELKTLSQSYYDWKNRQTAITNTGKQYMHSFVSGSSWNQYLDLQYAINGKYKKFQAIIAPLDGWNSRGVSKNIGTVKIFADDKLVYDSGITPSNTIHEKQIDLDITGTGVLRIQQEAQSYSDGGGYLGLCDVKLME